MWKSASGGNRTLTTQVRNHVDLNENLMKLATEVLSVTNRQRQKYFTPGGTFRGNSTLLSSLEQYWDKF